MKPGRLTSAARGLGASSMVAVSIWFAAIPAFAQAKPEPAATNTDDSAEWFAKGTTAYEAGNFAEAEELFLKVWAVRKAWDVAANLGLAQVNLGKHVEAAKHLTYALRGFPASEPGDTKAILERRLAKARAEIGALKVDVDVAGAELRVNGELSTTPIEDELFVSPGTVNVEVRKDGYEPVKRAITVAKGKSESLSIVLAPAMAPERSKLPAYIAGGVGIAGAIAGGALIGVALMERSDLANKLPRDENGNLICGKTGPDVHPDCPALRAQASQLDTLGNAGIGALIVGGALVAGAVTYYLWPSSKSETGKGASRILPVVGVDGASVVWMGSF